MSSIIIERIEIASFGKLKMIQVVPGKGINLLSAPNETGKSTLAAFIKFIFYGYTSGRVQNISDNDKKLYTPWDNPQSEGAIYLRTDDGRYKIERKYLQSGKESVEIFETHTGARLNPGISPGEHFFGVNDQVFERTAFFRQLTVPSGKDEYIAEQLQNIAMSADEKVNTTKASKRLTDAKNMLIGRGKSGIIPRLESEKDELDKRFGEAAETNKQIQELADKLADLRTKLNDNREALKRLGEEKENIAKYEAVLRLTQIKEAERNELRSKAEFEEAQKLLKKQDLPDNTYINNLFSLNAEYKSCQKQRVKLFDELKKEEAELEMLQKETAPDKTKAEETKKKVLSAKRANVFLAVLAVIFILAGGAGFLLDFSAAGISSAVLGVIFGILSIVKSGKSKKILTGYGVAKISELELIINGFPVAEQRISEKKAKINNINNSYSELINKLEDYKKRIEEGINDYIKLDASQSYDELIKKISDYTQHIKNKWASYKASCEIKAKAAENVDIAALMKEAEGAVKPEREKSKVESELKFYTQQTEFFETKEREADKQKAVLEGRGSDPAVLLGKRNAAADRINELRGKHSSLELALKILSESSDYMKSTVAPKINYYASEMFKDATKGKYNTLSVDTALAMSFADDSGKGAKSCEYLSAGTRDSAYLCLRLALIKLLYGEVNPPLVLDDAFGRLDDGRLEAIISVLASGNNSQTFVFTSGDREKNILDKNGIKYDLLSLQQK